MTATENMPPRPPLPARLRARRKELRLTLQELADRTGLARSVIGEIETGRRPGGLRTLAKLDAALGLGLLLAECVSGGVQKAEEK